MPNFTSVGATTNILHVRLAQYSFCNASFLPKVTAERNAAEATI
ncbi:hypothetical protein L914_01853 [Phytophthora nicotianae]|uniref:Uncharacterized protein n=1 Tax=Phytophthora nicotianae TaxID=4792 RepID=W2P2F4_PHYNI|nr:hypothetical protein L914_01853 [Phytophthora nicotianae]